MKGNGLTLSVAAQSSITQSPEQTAKETYSQLWLIASFLLWYLKDFELMEYPAFLGKSVSSGRRRKENMEGT